MRFIENRATGFSDLFAFRSICLKPSPKMSHTPVPATCKVILAQGIAKKLLGEVSADLQKLSFKPKLVGLLANEDPAAQQYADWSMATCIEK